jgi:hypothetical protein
MPKIIRPNIKDQDMNPITIGSKVKLKKDVLVKHAKSIPAHAGYSPEQFAWRNTLSKLQDKIGIVTRTFENSKHTNITFDTISKDFACEDAISIGIDYTELELAE